ncbi:MAG: PKD domain-containing protein [Candidatus Diapherotrites archaeon]
MQKKFACFVLFSLLFAACASAASCSWMRAANFGNSDRVLSILKAGNGTLLAGSGPNAEIFRSTDNGNSWQGAGQLANAERVTCLFEAPDGSILAGTSPNGGVFRSADSGGSWQSIGKPDALASNIIGFARKGSSVLMVANATDGTLFSSADNGNSWAKISAIASNSARLYSPFAVAVAADGTICAGGKLGWTQKGAVFRSADDGASWAEAELAGSSEVRSMLAASDGTVFAGTEPNGAVFVSRDNCASWQNMARLPGAEGVYSLFRAGDSSIYAGTLWNAEVFRTTDNGGSWSSTGRLPNAINVYALAQANDGGIIAGTRPESDIFKFLCVNSAPIADAGPNQAVEPNSAVVLDAGASYDPDADPLQFVWAQTGGTAVTLDLSSPKKPRFTAGEGNEVYEFRLVVRDNAVPPNESGPDTVRVTVKGACTEGSAADCTTASGCAGTKKCENSAWSECSPKRGICEPGAKIPCTPKIDGADCMALSGWRYCSACGAGFGDCNAQGLECCPGKKSECMAGGCAGARLCNAGGLFGECIKIDEGCREVPCASDADCLADEKCGGGKCGRIECPEGQIPKNHDCNSASESEEILYLLDRARDETKEGKFGDAKDSIEKAKGIAKRLNDPKLIEYLDSALESVSGGETQAADGWIVKAIRRLLGRESGGAGGGDAALQRNIFAAVAAISAAGLLLACAILLFKKKGRLLPLLKKMKPGKTL